MVGRKKLARHVSLATGRGLKIMPRLKRKTPRHRDQCGSDEVWFLVSGFALAGPGAWGLGQGLKYHDLPDETKAEIEKVYFANRDKVFERFHRFPQPGKRPWAFWEFEHPECIGNGLPDEENLSRLGLLTDDELTAIEAKETSSNPPGSGFHDPPFRRSWGWWRFVSPEPRDWDTPETKQLTRLPSFLTEREKQILVDGTDPSTGGHSTSAEALRTLSYLKLTENERDYLRIPRTN